MRTEEVVRGIAPFFCELTPLDETFTKNRGGVPRLFDNR